MSQDSSSASASPDHSSSDEFFQYYAEVSVSEQSMARFKGLKRSILRLLGSEKEVRELTVADIGCNGGGQSFLWAEDGHKVLGLDINEPLLELARKRAKEHSLDIEFTLGTATKMPWPDASVDVCIMPELLEHVSDWQACLNEAVRILKPKGLLFFSTTNKLCPKQNEFNLPLYSWYPGFVKRHYEKLAVTSRPELANHATYPAVNWFTFGQLRAFLTPKGFRCLDWFDIMDPSDSTKKALIVPLVRALPPLRFLAQFATPSTRMMAIKISK